MPTIKLSDSDLAKVRKALRRMAQRHRGDPGEGHGGDYDRICGEIDEQLARKDVGPGFIGDWSSAPMPVGRADAEIRLRIVAPHEAEGEFDSTLEEIVDANDPGDLEEDLSWARQAAPGETRRVYGGTGVYQDWTVLDEDRKAEREASPFSRMEKMAMRAGRAPTGSRVQSVLLDKEMFSQAAAKRWAKEHNFRTTQVDSQGNYWRFRQESPAKFKKIRTVEFRPGVRATVGWE